MILVIAALWVIVFIPSWFQNKLNHQRKRALGSDLRSQAKETRVSMNRPAMSKLRIEAVRGRKLSRTKNLMTALAMFFLLATTASVFFATQFPLLWIAMGFSLLVGISASLVSIKATNELKKLQVRIASAQSESTSRLANSWQEISTHKVESFVDSRAWTPNPLPSPAYQSRIGELEIQKLASVTEITQQVEIFDTQDEINKILRRRRATG